MKIDKKLKRLIMGGVGFAMAVVVFFTGSMQSMQDVTADVRVFDKITEKYPDANSFSMKVLEIVPSNPDSSREIGYFLKKDNDKESPTDVTYGTVHSPIFTSRNDPQYPTALYNLRTYGMIRPTGADATGIYPIYALGNGGAGVPVFSNYETDTCKYPYTQSFVKGVYEMAPGDYNIAQGYTIDSNGQICKITQVPVLSDNGVVSDNDPTYNPNTNMVTKYVPVEDIDLSELSLPKSVSVNYITEASEAGKGNVKFTRSETVTNKVQYYGYSDQKLYYMKMDNVKFHSSDYFREYVLGSRTKYADRQITYNTVQASAVTVEQVNEADLIYISGKSADFAKAAANDLKEDVMLEIYNKEVNEHKAVMMDYACYSSDADTNVSKLAILLWRESQSEIAQTYTTAYEDSNNPTAMTNVDFMTGANLRSLKSSMMTGADGNFVVGNVYVYNHHMSDFDDPKSMVDAGDNFANGDFNSLYKTRVTQQGFSSVLSYIATTNKYSTTGSMLPSVTPAVAIQYILISDGNPLTIMKSSLNVLEIQPVMSFLYNETRGSEEYGYLDNDGQIKTNRDNFIRNYLSNYYAGKEDYITFTSMTVDEFNGRNEDLIETYDIIYIGSEQGGLYETAKMNSASIDSQTGKYDSTKYQEIDLPVYNDTNMNGNVYYNIGDTLKVDRDRLMQYLDTDTDEARFAGRDITTDKLQKLKDYLDAENLILVEGDLFAEGEINPTEVEGGDRGRMDNSSNMYELIQYARGYRFDSSATSGDKTYANSSDEKTYDSYLNLISVKDIINKTVDKVIVEQYVATEKLALILLDQPKAYSYSLTAGTHVIDEDTVTYLDQKSNGKRALKYNFIISSDLEETDGVHTYTPYLYVDVNNDGKYSQTTENVRDMQIILAGTTQEADRDENNSYVLYKDVEYEMTRELDDTFSGYIKWKLSVQSNTYKNAHASEQGSTVVKNQGEDELIKILQITSPNVSNLDLEEQENDPTSKYGKYLANVPGYDVEIKTVTLTEYASDFDKKWSDYNKKYDEADPKPEETKMSLQEFALDYFKKVEIVAPSDNEKGLYGADMLVLGFGDDFPSIQSTGALTALQSYMESEKPVLLAHDFIMYWARASFYNGRGENDNKPALHGLYLRHNVGMDKYGVTQNITESTVGSVTVADLVNVALYPNTGYKYLHSGVSYNRGEDQDKIRLIESTGKSVAYKPSSNRSTILKNTQAISATTLMRFQAAGSDSKWLNAEGAGTTYFGRGTYEVDKMNDGQITSYPYILPEKFDVNGTHGQYFQLDMDVDDDDDGESDVVVWYTLGDYKPQQAYVDLAKEEITEEMKNSNDIATQDRVNAILEARSISTYDPYGPDEAGPVPAEGYYIYNKGNITYTGAGDSDMTNGTETEVQLFINTLFAAYNAAKVKPSVGFFEEVPDVDDRPISSIAVPYDENVTGDNAFDSSVLKDAQGDYRYYFVNPNVAAATMDMGTPVYFRLSDSNFVRGTKYMEIDYYLKVKGEENDTYTLDNNAVKTIEMLNYQGASVPVVNISDVMTTYNVSNKTFSSEIARDEITNKVSFLENGVVYGFYLPLSYLNDNSQVTIYIKAKTRIYTVSSQTGQESMEEVAGEGVSELTITKTDLLELK